MTVPGVALMELASSSRRELVLCAPFAKKAVVAQVLSCVPDNVQILLFTRWRPDEVAAGVSDTKVLDLLESRGGKVYLHDRLHAKFYRNESRVLLGSANLTATALGWSQSSNLELLVESVRGEIDLLEAELHTSSVIATRELAAEVEAIAALLVPEVAIPCRVVTQVAPGVWVPSLRMPADLYVAYSRGTAALTSRSAAAAASDLEALDLPLGLESAQFKCLVGNRILWHELFRVVDDFVAEPRRFGEVRRFISEYLSLDRDVADATWQVLMRWMLEFLPMRYMHSQVRHSEIFARRGRREDPSG